MVLITEKEAEIEYAKANGFHRLGKADIEVEYKLTEAEKVDIGKVQSETLCEVENLEAEFGKIRKEYKNKIETMQVIIRKSSVILKRGSKIVTENLPCFLDPKTKKKHYINLKTGEVIESREATEDDLQSDMFNL